MQKFHSKMTPRGLYTQFHLTEITYAKVCITAQWLSQTFASLIGGNWMTWGLLPGGDVSRTTS